MRPNGFGGPHFRPPPGPAVLDRGRQDVRTDQAGPSLLSPPGSVGPTAPTQNGWTPQAPGFAARPAAAPLSGSQRMPPGNLAGGLNNLSLNGGPAQSAQYYSKAPIGGGEYVQQHARRQQPPGPPLPRPPGAVGQPPSIPSRPGFGARGPPAFGKGTPAPSIGGPRPSVPGSAGRPASPSSPNKYASIPMPASPSPTTSARPAKFSQQQAAQMPLPPSQPRGLAPPSFNMPQQVMTPSCKLLQSGRACTMNIMLQQCALLLHFI